MVDCSQDDFLQDQSKQRPRRDGPRVAEECGAPTATTAALLGALVPWAVLVAANSPMLHPGAYALQTGRLRAPDPLTCLPGKCWDGADKYGYPLCTSGDSIKVRGVEVAKYEKTCYKAIYINFELTAAYALGVIMLYGMATSRIFERVFRAYFEHDARGYVALALTLDMPAWYYSAKVSFVYLNEFMHDMQRSQTFFGVTEFFVLIVLVLHVRRSDKARPAALILALGCSQFHICEILSMEYSNFFAGNYKQVRNYILIMGDIATAGAAALLLAEEDCVSAAGKSRGPTSHRHALVLGANPGVMVMDLVRRQSGREKVMWSWVSAVALQLVFRATSWDRGWTRL